MLCSEYCVLHNIYINLRSHEKKISHLLQITENYFVAQGVNIFTFRSQYGRDFAAVREEGDIFEDDSRLDVPCQPLEEAAWLHLRI